MSANEPMGPVTVTIQVPQVTINVIQQAVQTEPGQAVTAILTIGGKLTGAAPATSITVDETNKEASIHWVDDKGDTDAAAPAHAQVAFDSDNPAVATVDAQTGKITPVAEGTFNLSVTLTDSATGSTLMHADGTTPWTVNPAAVQVTPGAAVGAQLGVKQVS